MAFINIEIKARTTRASAIRDFLVNAGAELRGTDMQTDTYFEVPNGRLKLREGNIENNLIFYDREESAAGPKQSRVELMTISSGSPIKSILTKSIGIKAVVKKQREIWYIRNIKFHIDTVEQLGNFVEIEASNQFDDISGEELRRQCEEFMKAFQITEEDLIDRSYSDMISEKSKVKS